MIAKSPALALVAGLAALLAGCHAPATPPHELTLAGAQIPVSLTRSWLRTAEQPGFRVEVVWPQRYAQDGFDALRKGDCDLACTDRPMTARELPAFENIPLGARRIAFYGYALYVHPDNPLEALFSKHFTLILQGQITDWSQLFDSTDPPFSGPIHVYGPPKGTRAGQTLAPLARIFLDDPRWTVLDSDAKIVAAVAADPHGLGFASIGYDQDARYLGLRMERRGPAAYPSLEEIEREGYGLAKVLYVYYRTPPRPAVQAALDYLAAPAGHDAIAETDVWPIPNERRALDPVP
jgi:phosphate transport system substrate-binding protein